eukprot:2710590-Rhodomonas_salina.1
MPWYACAMQSPLCTDRIVLRARYAESGPSCTDLRTSRAVVRLAPGKDRGYWVGVSGSDAGYVGTRKTPRRTRFWSG